MKAPVLDNDRIVPGEPRFPANAVPKSMLLRLRFRLSRRYREESIIMVKKRSYAALLAAVLIAAIAPNCQAQYTTDWVANTFGAYAADVGNAARSMWVAPEGVIYTASMWDENEGGVAIYRNGQ